MQPRNKSTAFAGWGRITQPTHAVHPLYWADDVASATAGASTYLAHGCGRSYGDSCTNTDALLLPTTGMNRLMAFNEETGVLRAEAGITFDEILQFAVPRGWFLPVSPGTKFVTLGGAIANDVHGKNHHRRGAFGQHVQSLALHRSDTGLQICSPTANSDLFRATIGGLGLTGVITWAEFQLIPIKSAFINQEVLRLKNLDDFFRHDDESAAAYEYTVSWIDCLATGSSLGRGLFMRGNHADQAPRGKPPLPVHRPPRLTVPCSAPGFLLNHATIKLFNEAYFRKPVPRGLHAVHYEPFFYPLDVVGQWNRLYGKRGFFQYQCVLPLADGRAAVTALLQIIARSGNASFLTVLKKFGDLPSPGLMSFPRSGLTLALDFPNTGAAVRRMMNELDAVVIAHGGCLYPAKDARMSSALFKRSFPQWATFARFVDPKMSSDFWRRVTAD